MSWQLRRTAIPFHRTLTNQIPQNPSFPFEIRTNNCNMNSSARVPSRNATCTIVITFIQLVVSGKSSCVEGIIHWQIFSARIPEGPPEQCSQSLQTAQAISSYSRKPLSTDKERVPVGIGSTGGGKCRYRYLLYAVIVMRATLDGGGERYNAALYHPHICIHDSWIRCGSDVRRDSATDPILTDNMHLPS